MTAILVTGGRGVLGHQLVPRLQRAGHAVRVMSRAPRPASLGSVDAPPQWAQADLASGAGLEAAVAGIQVVIHAASDPRRATQAVDVEGTQRLLDAAHRAGVEHFVYVSIVGVDSIPYSYYRHKHATEAVVRTGRLPYSILRATQFHSLLEAVLVWPGRLPVRLIPAGFVFQPVDPGEVAERLVQIALGTPGGRLPDFGGPAVRTAEDLARSWTRIRRRRVLIVPVPLPGATAGGFRAGLNTCPDQAHGRVTWEEYLSR
jgi:uncharacterized protein YbjT (DUF2867 family)